MTYGRESVPTIADRVCAAVNSHDLALVVDCFTEDYVNETPAHPERGFRGRQQVRRNWERIFAELPDIDATLLAHDQVGDRVWSEWEMSGSGRDGARHLLRGVMLFTVAGDRASAVRFYLEPVELGGDDADGAIDRLVAEHRQ